MKSNEKVDLRTENPLNKKRIPRKIKKKIKRRMIMMKKMKKVWMMT
jgi:hypothetical protein